MCLKGVTPLTLCVARQLTGALGYADLALTLLKHPSLDLDFPQDPSKSSSLALLLKANPSSGGKLIRVLQKPPTNVNYRFGCDDQTAIFHCTDMEGLNYCLKIGCSLQIHDVSGSTPLVHFIKKENLDLARALLDLMKGDNCPGWDFVDPRGNTILMMVMLSLASENKKADFIKQLVEKLKQPDQQECLKYTRFKDLTGFINYQNHHNQTALQQAHSIFHDSAHIGPMSNIWSYLDRNCKKNGENSIDM